jgi:hypothetical protein
MESRFVVVALSQVGWIWQESNHWKAYSFSAGVLAGRRFRTAAEAEDWCRCRHLWHQIEVISG